MPSNPLEYHVGAVIAASISRNESKRIIAANSIVRKDLLDYSVETVNGQQIRKKKVNRPKALCFDYLILKDAFGIDLETEVLER